VPLNKASVIKHNKCTCTAPEEEYSSELYSLYSIIKYIALAIVGGICGSLLAVSLSEQTMNYMACVLLLLASVVTFKNKAWTEVPDSLEHQAPHFWQPFIIAMYDGGFGPGSSTFSILHYLRSHHTYIKAYP